MVCIYIYIYMVSVNHGLDMLKIHLNKYCIYYLLLLFDRLYLWMQFYWKILCLHICYIFSDYTMIYCICTILWPFYYHRYGYMLDVFFAYHKCCFWSKFDYLVPTYIWNILELWKYMHWNRYDLVSL